MALFIAVIGEISTDLELLSARRRCGSHGRDEKYKVLVRKREAKSPLKSLDIVLILTT
jgi:hypothetical protein